MTKPVPPPVTPPPPLPVLPTEVTSALTTWVNTVGASAITQGLKQLLAEEPELIQGLMKTVMAPGSPVTAYLNGWLNQFRTDYSPGGVLEQTGSNIAKNFKVRFLPNPEGEADE